MATTSWEMLFGEQTGINIASVVRIKRMAVLVAV